MLFDLARSRPQRGVDTFFQATFSDRSKDLRPHRAANRSFRRSDDLVFIESQNPISVNKQKLIYNFNTSKIRCLLHTSARFIIAFHGIAQNAVD